MHPRAHADLPRRLAARPHPIPTTSSRAHPTGTSFHGDATPLARLLRFVLVLAALPLIALTALPAAAKCMLPGPALTPGAGTVPARPVLRLLMPARGAPDGLPRVIARLGGKQVPVTVTADTAAGDLRAYRVVVTAATAGKLEISLQNDHGDTTRTWTLAVDPRWRPPASSSAAVAVSRQASRWTCSHQHTRNLRFHGAAAPYRVVLADTAADLTSDRTTSVVVPADTAAFFHAASDAPDHPQREVGSRALAGLAAEVRPAELEMGAGAELAGRAGEDPLIKRAGRAQRAVGERAVGDGNVDVRPVRALRIEAGELSLAGEVSLRRSRASSSRI